MSDYDDVFDPGDYSFPDQHLEMLYQLDINNPKYSIIQGDLYEKMRNDSRIDTCTAMDVTRFLNNGEVVKAEEKIFEVLEE